MTSGVAPADFGPRMKRARETRGVTLREIATRTKISVSALEALERNDISRLPGGIFVRAFVRAYAEEVGLDPEQTIREFIEAFPHDSVTAGSPYVPAEDHTAVESSRRSAETAVKLAAISVPIAIAIIYFTMAGGSELEQPQPAPAAQAAPPPPVQAPPADAAPLAIELVATAPVGVTLITDGVPEDPRTMHAGERRALVIERGLALSVTNAAALQLTINGQPAAALGGAGEPRTVQIDRTTQASFLAPQ
jgi:cytoskeletal protein RodZ